MSKRGTLLVSVAAMLVVVSGAYFVGTVAANHLLHNGMVQDIQLPPLESGLDTLPENYVNLKWAQYGTGEPITWYAEPDVFLYRRNDYVDHDAPL